MNDLSSIFAAPELFSGENRYQRPKRAAELANISRSTLYRLLGAGLITAKKLGSRLTMIDMRSVAQLYENAPSYMPASIATAQALEMDKRLGLGPAAVAAVAPPAAPDLAFGEADLAELVGVAERPAGEGHQDADPGAAMPVAPALARRRII